MKINKTCKNCASGQPGVLSVCATTMMDKDENGVCCGWHRKDCRYFNRVDTTDWHSDVFDHPTYTYYCLRGDQKKEILYTTCNYCQNRED